MSATHATTADSPVIKKVSPVMQKGAVIEQNSAQPATVLAPRVQIVADLIAETRARRIRESEASRAPEGALVQP